MSRFLIFALALFVFVPFSAQASITRTILEKSVTIKPGGKYKLDLPSKEPLRIGWSHTKKQKKTCEGPCVRAHTVDIHGNTPYLEAKKGNATDYTPIDGKISITYENIAKHPVVLEIYGERRICDSAACKFLKKAGTPHPFNYDVIEQSSNQVVIKKLSSIKTSKDGSYSRIKGISMDDQKFDVYAIWWLYEAPEVISYEEPIIKDDAFEGHTTKTLPTCAENIKEHGKYKRNAKQAYSFNGLQITSPETSIFTNVDCAFTPVTLKKKRYY